MQSMLALEFSAVLCGVMMVVADAAAGDVERPFDRPEVLTF